MGAPCLIPLFGQIDENGVINSANISLDPLSTIVEIVFLCQHIVFEAPANLVKCLFNVQLDHKTFGFLALPEIHSLICHKNDIIYLSTHNKSHMIFRNGIREHFLESLSYYFSNNVV